MFIILGGDGKEYGPVTTAYLHQWMIEGRVNLQTQARRTNEAEWRSLGDFPEFNRSAPATPSNPPRLAPGSPADVVPDHELAEPGTRLGAFIIDYLLSMLVMLPGALVVGPTFFSLMLAASRGEQPDVNSLNAGRILLGLLLLLFGGFALLVVQVVMLSTRGQTIGKRLLGIRVVRHLDDSPVGFMHGWLLRNFVPGLIQMVPWVGLAFYVVDACFIFSRERRCLHDLIAGTKVVKASAAPDARAAFPGRLS